MRADFRQQRIKLPSVSARWLQLYALALGLSLLFMLFSFSRVLLNYDFLFLGDKVLDSALDTPLLGTRLGTQVIAFTVTQVVLHASFALVIWAFAALTHYASRSRTDNRTAYLLGWFLLLACATFVANAYYYPWSALGEQFASAVSYKVAGITLAPALLIAAGILAFVILGRAAAKFLRTSHAAPLVASTSIAVVVLSMLVTQLTGAQQTVASGQEAKPHIILIGVDSLRPDFTSLHGEERYTPHINAFLAKARAFTDVTTPLARTFPSWVTILTGRHPHDTGAIMNLTDRQSIQAHPTLAEILSGRGYRTIFAMDEVHFANIDKSYGFDQILSPPAGAADFLLSAINDAPLSNIISGTAISATLFATTHANRGAAHLYMPEDFLDVLDDGLTFSEPTFLAVHFTLPHYPFFWARAERNGKTGVRRIRDTSMYVQAVRAADAQVGALLEILQRKGALDNAIVVLLSDHGEALNRRSDALLDPEERNIQNFDVRFSNSGHGTSVLSSAQYEVVLAFRGYGLSPLNQLPSARFAQPASLEDVVPTTLSLLDVEMDPTDFSGHSLAPAIQGDVEQSIPRIRFTETEFNPPALSAGFNAEKELARQGVKFYRVDPATGLVTLRPEMKTEVLKDREYAALGTRYILAALPGPQRDRVDDVEHRYVLVSRDRSESPRLISNRATLPPDEEVVHLWDALHKRFDLCGFDSSPSP